MVEKYLKISINKWCFGNYKQQLTGRLRTTTCFIQTKFSTHSCHLDRCTAPSVNLYAWKELGPSFPTPWQTGGLLPPAWGKSPLPFHMHEIKSVHSGQDCHCWLSQGCLKGLLFPHCFSKDLPKNVSIQTTITQDSSRGARNNSTQGSKFNSNFKDFSCHS